MHFKKSGYGGRASMQLRETFVSSFVLSHAAFHWDRELVFTSIPGGHSLRSVKNRRGEVL